VLVAEHSDAGLDRHGHRLWQAGNDPLGTH
jgi:hypothetical protein